ncbi:MAG: NAD-dependent epimerase/dehydratase family protein [Rhodothermales bacterium]|nr:NAD-dependent epimerase/dehydratase family protein [Rhodothermales bacterium]
MKRAFVTGGTGFVGSHLVEALLSRGYSVACLVRNHPKWLQGLPVDFIRGDLSSTASLERALEDVTHVYHVAGLTRAANEAMLLHANVTGTVDLLKTIRRSASNVERVLVTSSLAAVGFSERLIATEASPLRPISAYGRSKARMEDAIAALQKDRAWNDLPVTIVRPPAVYGPREKDIFTFIRMLSLGVAPMVGSGALPELSLVYVVDLVEGMILAAESPEAAGKTYFMGSEEQYSWKDVKQATQRALGKKRALTIPVPRSIVPTIGSVVEFGGRIFGKLPPLNEEKAIEILKACKMCSSARAAQDFGYHQKTTLDAGLVETVEWYRQQGWL